MTDTKLLICEGACNPDLGKLDEQRREACREWRPEHAAMPSMQEAWLTAMRQARHTPHQQEAPGFMGNIWTCAVCGASRRW